MLHPLNVCKILAPVDLTAPKVAAGKNLFDNISQIDEMSAVIVLAWEGLHGL